jgi:hypothetical protein
VLDHSANDSILDFAVVQVDTDFIDVLACQRQGLSPSPSFLGLLVTSDYLLSSYRSIDWTEQNVCGEGHVQTLFANSTLPTIFCAVFAILAILTGVTWVGTGTSR